MTRYKAIIEYDGTNFCGWQMQKKDRNIQNTIENAIFSFSNERVKVTASGRTDSGVHALGQVIHFDIVKNIPAYKILEAINYFLKRDSNDVVLLSCEEVKKTFHSCFDAKKRTYCYKILNRDQNSPVLKNKVWHIRKELNIKAMQESANILIGEHDFSSFRDSLCQSKTPIKEIFTVNFSKNEDIISFEISGRAFLHHMVRNIIGTVVDVGINKISKDRFKYIFEGKDRRLAGITAPACGLYLVRVEY